MVKNKATRVSLPRDARTLQLGIWLFFIWWGPMGLGLFEISLRKRRRHEFVA
jgi:hypothetical protein